MTGGRVPSGPARILAVPSHGWSICNVLCYKWVARLEGHAWGATWAAGWGTVGVKTRAWRLAGEWYRS